MHAIDAVTAVAEVVAYFTVYGILSIVAPKRIVAIATPNRVVTLIAMHRVVTIAGVNRIVPLIAEDRVVTKTAVDRVASSPAMNCVVAAAAFDVVVAGTTVDHRSDDDAIVDGYVIIACQPGNVDGVDKRHVEKTLISIDIDLELSGIKATDGHLHLD